MNNAETSSVLAPANKINLSKIAFPESNRKQRLWEQWRRLLPHEQAVVLTDLDSRYKGERLPDYRIRATEIAADWSERRRTTRLRRLLSTMGDENVDKFTAEALFKQYQKYLPALLAASVAVLRGDDVGVASARSSFKGNIGLMSVLQRFLGYAIPENLRYFVNDPEKNKRLMPADPTCHPSFGESALLDDGSQLIPLSGSVSRKFQVLAGYVSGFCFTEDGSLKVRPRKYHQIVYYDDEMSSTQALRECVLKTGLDSVIQVKHVSDLSHKTLWDELVSHMDQPLVDPDRRPTGVLHFFDIDGTLINVPAWIYVIRQDTGERLRHITQEDLGRYPDAHHWIQITRSERPELANVPLTLEYRDFTDPERVADYARPGMFHQPRLPFFL